MKIAIQACSLGSKTAEEFKENMKKIKDMGYDGVELAGLHGMPAREVLDYLNGIGLEICSAHIGIGDLEKDEVLDEYASIGVKYVAIPATPFVPFGEDVQSVIDAADRAKKIAERCKERGMQLIFHNHTAEFKKYGGEYALDIFLSRAGIDNVKPQYDTAWVNNAGEDPVAWVEKYSGNLPNIHIKDFVGRREDRFVPFAYKDADESEIAPLEFAPVGYGAMDMPALIDACRKAGVEWYIIEQDRPAPGMTALECAEKGLKYLREI